MKLTDVATAAKAAEAFLRLQQIRDDATRGREVMVALISDRGTFTVGADVHLTGEEALATLDAAADALRSLLSRLGVYGLPRVTTAVQLSEEPPEPPEPPAPDFRVEADPLVGARVDSADVDDVQF